MDLLIQYLRSRLEEQVLRLVRLVLSTLLLDLKQKQPLFSFPLTAVAVRYALAISALVMAVDKDFWFIAAAFRTDWTRSFRRNVELCFCF